MAFIDLLLLSCLIIYLFDFAGLHLIKHVSASKKMHKTHLKRFIQHVKEQTLFRSGIKVAVYWSMILLKVWQYIISVRLFKLGLYLYIQILPEKTI